MMMIMMWKLMVTMMIVGKCDVYDVGDEAVYNEEIFTGEVDEYDNKGGYESTVHEITSNYLL
jgi:hypothetical protein